MVHEGHARKPLVWLRVYSGEVRQAATLCAPGCNRMASGLQPYVLQAVTVWHPGCNRMASRLQPYGIQAATLWHPGCNPMCIQVRRGDTLLNTRTGEREVVAQLYPYP